MNLETMYSNLLAWMPVSGLLFFGIIFVYLVQKILIYQNKKSIKSNIVFSQLFILILSLLLIVLLIISTPLSDATKGNLLSFFGIIISAAIALSSTTFLGNIMAGFMIRTLRKFEPGDFLDIDGYLGRVTELGLLHTEIQTSNRNLVIMPNILLVSKPLKVINEGTLVSAEVSLGYDVDRLKIEAALVRAAFSTQLENPFVHVISLGDFSVLYKVSGILNDVKTLMSCKSALHANVIDSLHLDGIEIISPNFMNQRVFGKTDGFIPEYSHEKKVQTNKEVADKVMFDKAQEAEDIEDLKLDIVSLEEKIKELESHNNTKLQDEIDNLKEKLIRYKKILKK